MEARVLLRRRTPAQKRISQSRARFNVACFGRQSGKTTFGIDKMIERPLTGRYGGIYWHVLQTYSAADVAFDRMDRLLYNTGLTRKKSNESELCQFLQNGANVFFKSGDKPHNLRTETLDGAIIDECREQQSIVWSQIVMPMLGRHNGWADFLSTPNGFDWFYDLFQKAKNENPDGQWATFHSPSTECWWWTQEQIAQARANMSEAEFAQEIMAEFRNLVAGSSYYNFGDHNLRSQNPFAVPGLSVSPYLPVHLYCDFNVLPIGWAMAQYRPGSGHHFFDEIFLEARSNTEEASIEFVEKFRSLEIRANPQVLICGDATGKAQKTSSSGETDYSILFAALKAAGITYDDRTPNSNPTVKDRVNTMNARFKAADGSVQITVDPAHCSKLVKDWQRVSWKQGASAILDQTTDKLLTHISDAAGYGVYVFNPINGMNDVGSLRVIRR